MEAIPSKLRRLMELKNSPHPKKLAKESDAAHGRKKSGSSENKKSDGKKIMGKKLATLYDSKAKYAGESKTVCEEVDNKLDMVQQSEERLSSKRKRKQGDELRFLLENENLTTSSNKKRKHKKENLTTSSNKKRKHKKKYLDAKKKKHNKAKNVDPTDYSLHETFKSGEVVTAPPKLEFPKKATTEDKKALDLMWQWECTDIAVELEQLYPLFKSERVRASGVNVLEGAKDEKLQFYMLQLVQALRLKHLQEDEELQFYMHQLVQALRLKHVQALQLKHVQALQFERSGNLMLFLVRRSVHNNDLAHCFLWHLMVEFHYAKGSYVIDQILQDDKHKLEGREDDDGVKMLQGLLRQTKLIAQLRTTMEYVKTVQDTKVKSLQERLAGPMSELINSEKEIPLPLDPKVLITGIIPEESSIFRSAKQPLSLTFKTVDGGKCQVMFKNDDDLRQDQLVTQMVLLMDRLLKQEKLDLQLTPYKVLATGNREGMIELIPSKSLGQIILSKHRSLVNYLRQYHPDENGRVGITATCLETFIKSCAGYCVITYILGVGDRNRDNILLRDDGRLFHVDFGQILDKDPKMILYMEMVEAMDGPGSEYFERFKDYCCKAYMILRKSSNRILNLFHLMAGSSIPAFASDPNKVILELRERFCLHLVDDKAAKEFFQSQINECQIRDCWAPLTFRSLERVLVPVVPAVLHPEMRELVRLRMLLSGVPGSLRTDEQVVLNLEERLALFCTNRMLMLMPRLMLQSSVP